MNIPSLHTVHALLKWWFIPLTARWKLKDVILIIAQRGFVTCLNIWTFANCCCKGSGWIWGRCYWMKFYYSCCEDGQSRESGRSVPNLNTDENINNFCISDTYLHLLKRMDYIQEDREYLCWCQDNIDSRAVKSFLSINNIN